MIPTINTPSSVINWDVEVSPSLFDIGYSDLNLSAIDSFNKKNHELNLMITDPGRSQTTIDSMISNNEVDAVEARKIIAKLAGSTQVNPGLMNLVLLGYVSSVEGYLRHLIRELVNLDPSVKEQCGLKTINFGTTYFLSKEMFPEALMDSVSFISKKSIIEACKELLDLNMNDQQGSSLHKALNDYHSVCQLRHCIVHRFGKIGATNAIKLGLNEHSYASCLEKPINMNYVAIQKVSKVTVNVVREVNQFICSRVLKRLIKAGNTWVTWDYRKDKALWTKYISLFYEAGGDPLADKAKNIYIELRKKHEAGE